MRKAYDTILQSEVSAALAAQNGGSEPYRYECACCGEEVYIAAAYSTCMVAHFRHRSGNNDTECENYLGRYGVFTTDPRSRKSYREKVEFYYENKTKTFNVGVRYSANEISEYELHKSDFEISVNDTTHPFCALPINTNHFTSDVPTLISLDRFSYSYYISNTLIGNVREFDFFKSGNVPTFFKIQGGDDNFKARLVRNETLFTNVQYFVALQNKYAFPAGIQFPSEIQVNKTFQFETMGRKFLGMVLSIESKTVCVDALLNSWNYKLEASETLTLLWPPAALIDDVCVVHSDNAFVYTSFELQAHGNINVQSADIFKVNCGVSTIAIKSKTKIFKKNAEIIIDKRDQQSADYSVIASIDSVDSVCTVSDDGSYFLFNSSGVTPLVNGQVVMLTPKSEIRRYNFGYLTGCFHPRHHEELAGEALLNDILIHYKRESVLDLNVFASLKMSDIASRYINKCKDSDSINAVAKQCIIEGLI